MFETFSLFLLILVANVLYTSAFWNQKLSSLSAHDVTHANDDAMHALPPALLSNTLDNSPTVMGSDCFQDAISSIRARCDDVLVANTEERVKAAISLTMCELATARHNPPPLECTTFLSIITRNARHDVSSCVGALSRSSQYWSSYSGYLRDIPQLCSAYRQWHNIDTAKALYRNATIEKATLLKLLQSHEFKMMEMLENVSADILGFASVRDRLETHTVELEVVVQTMTAFFSQTENRFNNMLADFESRHKNELNARLVEFQTDLLGRLSADASVYLSNILGAAVTPVFQQMERNISDYALALYTVFNLLENKSEDVGQELELLIEKMALLNIMVNGISSQSRRSIRDLTSMKTLQSENLDILNNMTENIASFADTAHSGLARLNETAYNALRFPSKSAITTLISHSFKILIEDGLPRKLYGLPIVMKWSSCILAALWIFFRSVIGFSLLLFRFIKPRINVGARQPSSSRQNSHIPGIRVSRIPDRLYRKTELI